MLGSPRMRRRLVRVGALAVLCAAVAVVAVVLPNTNGNVKSKFSNAPVQRVIREREVPVTSKRRADVNALFDDFVPEAVARKDPGAAYDLVTPSFRAGTSRSSWRAGELPVYPYQPRGDSFHGWTVDTSFRDTMSVELYLQPRDPRNGPVAVNVDLRRLHGRWLIDSFYPRTSYAPTRSASPEATPTTRVAARSAGRTAGAQRAHVGAHPHVLLTRAADAGRHRRRVLVARPPQPPTRLSSA